MENLCFEYKKNDTGISLTKFISGGEKIVIPEFYDGHKVTTIGPECFQENGIMITEITIPSTVTILENDAFAYCVSLEKLNLPETISKIGADYLLASGLKEAYIPADVMQIDRPELIDRAFKVSPQNTKYFTDGYGLYEKTPSGARLIAVNSSEQRARYDLDEATTEIAFNALRDASVIEVLGIPSRLFRVDEGALSFNGGTVNEEKGVKGVDISVENTSFILINGAFCEKSEDGSYKIIRYFGGSTAVIPENISIIGAESFKNTPINRLELNTKIKEIREKAFSGCTVKSCCIGDTQISFGNEDRFTMEQLLEGFGKNGKIYDFTILDNFLKKEYITAERVNMMTVRMLYPRDLSEETKMYFRDKINNELKEILRLLTIAQDIQTMENLGELKFFTEDNIEWIIDYMNYLHEKEFTAWFMSYKNNNNLAETSGLMFL